MCDSPFTHLPGTRCTSKSMTPNHHQIHSRNIPYSGSVGPDFHRDPEITQLSTIKSTAANHITITIFNSAIIPTLGNNPSQNKKILF
uniref:Uncharacterized protein n=1 Tax=Octopus bimaculoides TaxID=37653 RepID=A0A0L8HJ97_OCTBM